MSSQLGTVSRWWSSAVPCIADAYDACERITYQHSRSFYFATAFLPRPKRRAVRALYAFCRWSDDIVDEPGRVGDYSFEGWVSRAHSDHADPRDPVLVAWVDTRRRHRLSRSIIDELLAGVRMDLSITRYETFEELTLYCYRVASTVGLLAMEIIGAEAEAHEYAIQLGIALQLTNILRDVGEDARRGRIYLPLEEVARFGLSEGDILAGCQDERYEALMRFQIARAQHYYEAARPGLTLLHPDGQFAVAAAAEVYRAILPAIKRNGFDNHNQRAYVPAWHKLALLPRAWWQSRGR